MTDHHLLLAPKAAPQPTCQKCRRHGDSVHLPVRHYFMKTDVIEKEFNIREMIGYPPILKREEDTLIYSRKHSNGDAYWWRPNGSGYTSDLNQAGRYTAEEAASCCRSTHGDNVPILESVALAIEARRTLYRRDIEDILSNVPRHLSVLAFGMISCASRSHDKSPEGTGIRWTSLFAFMLFSCLRLLQL